jgi:hypothetical protein
MSPGGIFLSFYNFIFQISFTGGDEKLKIIPEFKFKNLRLLSYQKIWTKKNPLPEIQLIMYFECILILHKFCVNFTQNFV